MQYIWYETPCERVFEAPKGSRATGWEPPLKASAASFTAVSDGSLHRGHLKTALLKEAGLYRGCRHSRISQGCGSAGGLLACHAQSPDTTQTRLGGPCLWSQLLGGRDRWIRTSRSSLAIERGRGQPGLHEILSSKQKQARNDGGLPLDPALVRQMQADLHEFKANLIYMVNCRTAWSM